MHPKRATKTRLRLFLRVAALCLSPCGSCNARKISRTCTTVLQEHHQKNLQIPFNSSTRHFWQEANSLQSSATSNKQVPRLNGILYIRLFKACIGLDVDTVQWRFRIMQAPRVGSSLTPSERPDPQIDPSRASLTPNLLTNNLSWVVHVKYPWLLQSHAVALVYAKYRSYTKHHLWESQTNPPFQGQKSRENCFDFNLNSSVR